MAAQQFAFDLIKGNERRFLSQGFDHDLPSFELVGVKGVQRLTQFVQHEVGDVHHIVDGAQTDGFEAFFEPFGAFCDGNAFGRNGTLYISLV